MQPSATELQELKAATGITDFSAVTLEQFAEVMKKAAQKSLTLERLRLLVQVMPQFVQLLGGTIEGLKKVAEAAHANQKEVVQAIGGSLKSLHDTLNVTAHNAQTDEARLEIAKISVEATKVGIGILEKINTANNAFWWKVAAISGPTAVAIGIAVLVGVLSGGRVKPPIGFPRA